MSEYCSECSPFENAFDIDLFKIALNLKNGRSESFVCEGCNNRALYKDENGNIYLAKNISGTIQLHSVKIENLIKV